MCRVGKSLRRRSNGLRVKKQLFQVAMVAGQDVLRSNTILLHAAGHAAL
jgi:hypothetical protein